jgi:hypothetical protein
MILGGPYMLKRCGMLMLPCEVASARRPCRSAATEHGARARDSRMPREREVGTPDVRISAPLRTPLSAEMRSAPRREPSPTARVSCGGWGGMG